MANAPAAALGSRLRGNDGIARWKIRLIETDNPDWLHRYI